MNFQTATQAALGRWHDILPRLGIDRKYLSSKHGPCPICGGKDRFRFDNKLSKGNWFCSQCGSGDGFELISKIKGLSKSQTKDLVIPLIEVSSYKAVKEPISADRSLQRSKQLWDQCAKVTEDDLVGLYLTHRLGEFVPSSALRRGFEAHYPSGGKKYTTMAALISDSDGRGVSVHRTFLSEAGFKADIAPNRMIMAGAVPAGSAIRLFKASSHMGIAEGIETALAAYILTGIPTWSAINANMVEKFEPPKSVKKLTIFSDNDANFTGQAAAYNLANRLVLKHKMAVEVRVPSQIGKDYADMLGQGSPGDWSD